MIPFEEAYRTVMKHACPLKGGESVPLQSSIGRILARDIHTDRDIPPFHRVAMDGYACRRQDLPGPFKVIGDLPAGHPPDQSVGPGQCIKVMTGASLPSGADMVFMVEYARSPEAGKIRFHGPEKAALPDHYARRGEDSPAGRKVMSRGKRIRSVHLGLLASLGHHHPAVGRRPRVGVISTGDELVPPHARPLPHQIRDANSIQLIGLLNECPVRYRHYGIFPDRFDSIRSALVKAAGECDVILLSGGVSMGDFDLVPRAMTAAGFKILFDRIALKPGKPTTFSHRKEKTCFGMPGNPVSSFVAFNLLVRPFLMKMMGHPYRTETIPCRLSEPLSRRKTHRDEWIPVQVSTNGEATPQTYHGSGDYLGLSRASGILLFPRGEKTLPQGEPVHVRRI